MSALAGAWPPKAIGPEGAGEPSVAAGAGGDASDERLRRQVGACGQGWGGGVAVAGRCEGVEV
jgi:hypothetical protein